jgi:hypothetical protein
VSYCRKTSPPGSDVYVLGSHDPPGILCCNCPLLGGAKDFLADDAGEMVGHLKTHLAAGQRVPKAATRRLGQERAGAGATSTASRIGTGPASPGARAERRR